MGEILVEVYPQLSDIQVLLPRGPGPVHGIRVTCVRSGAWGDVTYQRGPGGDAEGRDVWAEGGDMTGDMPRCVLGWGTCRDGDLGT